MTIRALCVSLLVLAAATSAVSAENAGPAERTVVLDTTGFWRIYQVLHPPVIRIGDELKPVLLNAWLDRPTALPPQDWTTLGFDDSQWLRGPARISIRTPYAALICMRSRFTVTDLASVRDLQLTLAYHGGVVVYLNGREIARRDLPDGAITADTLADAYPREAFVSVKGRVLADWNDTDAAANQQRLALRERKLEAVTIPSNALRPGANVLALEVHRAPYDQAIEELKDDKPGRKGSVYNLSFNTCEVVRVQLSAASADGVSQEAVRSHGLQLWNSDVLASDFDLDFAGPSELLYPVRIVGPKGGIVSGKIVAGSDAPLKGLRATLGSLEGPAGATIPDTVVRIRYGAAWGEEAGVWGAKKTYWDMDFSRYPRKPTLLSALAERPPETVAVHPVEATGGRDLQTPNQPEPVFGAVVPVWVTINVPRDARPGTYRATLRVEADGETPCTVPVELKVADWTLPEVAERRTWSELIQVPDTTTIEYGVAMWSEEHWRMIAHAFDLIGETSSRVLYLPLVCNTNIGTEQSLVRWIRQPDGSWRHDFTLLERYLDTAIEHMGKPRLAVLYAWDIYQLQSDTIRKSTSHDQERRALGNVRPARGAGATGPVVSTINSATGQTGQEGLPHFDAPDSEALWRPVFSKLLGILQKRGLTESAALGCLSDAWPNPDEARTLKTLSGGLPWVSFSHMGVETWRLYDLADVCYQATVTQNRYANSNPPMGSYHGWAGSSWPGPLSMPIEERLAQTRLFAENARGGRSFATCPASRLRNAGEFNITGDQHGIGRLGADFWPAVKNSYGMRVGRASERFPQSSWRNQDLESSLLAPGPDGPVSTHHFEAFREGLQECEARAFIEQALLDPDSRQRLGEPLATRCTELLVERTQYMLKSLGQMRLTGPVHWYVTVDYTYWHRSEGPIGHAWFLGSLWQQRSEALFDLAAEVSRKLR